MKHLTIILLTWLGVFSQQVQGLYTCKNAYVSIYSSAPLEDISAETSTEQSVFNATTGDLAFSLNIRSLTFKKSLMQEHFNTDYMESDKYPKATFKGKIQEHIDVTKDGTYPVTAIGELNVHGVPQQRTIQGKIIVAGGTVKMSSEFMVKCADHHIDIPKLVFHNIAETIKVTVNATYTAYK